jgi:hypothetical protein
MHIYTFVVVVLAALLLLKRIAILSVTGWRLITLHRKRTQRRQSSASSAAKPESAIEPDPRTVELPVSPAISYIMVRENARRLRIIKIVMICVVSFSLLVGAAIDLTVPSQSGIKVFLYLAAAGLAFGLFIGGVCILASRGLRRDLADFTYIRTTGPLQLVRIHGGYLLKLADRTFALNVPAVAAAVRNLTWATVDYSRHAHLIFDIWDSSGRRVYTLGEARRPVSSRAGFRAPR